MRKLQALRTVTIVTLALSATIAAAQSRTRPHRFFLNFVEEPTLAQKQWWEGQLRHADGEVAGENFDSTVIQGIVALQPWEGVEVGAQVGFGRTDAASGLPDGTGATDLDLWGKYDLGQLGTRVDFAVGGILTLPTGDDTAGLGSDAFGLKGFASMIHRARRASFTANLGVQLNDDSTTFGLAERDGEVSGSLGLGLLYPTSDRTSFVAELNGASERFDGGDNDIRLLGGVNWLTRQDGTVRGAVAFGLDDGAPDVQLTVGYAGQF